MWPARVGSLPNGAVAIDPDDPERAGLVQNGTLAPFHFGGWGRPRVLAANATLQVLTPPTSIIALRNGFVPVLHPTADQTGPI